MQQTKQKHYLMASISLLLFVFLGYIVKFYPENLVTFDTTVQTAVRGELPSFLTSFFTKITVLGNTSSQVIIALTIFIILFWKGYKVEASFNMSSAIIAGLSILILKNIYQRPRPSITWLIEEHGYSFPSGHSTGSFLIWGSLIIIIHQRLEKGPLRTGVELLLACMIFIIGLSRIYVGVHYPTDVLGGFILSFGILNLIYPTYERLRFKARFTGKQK